MYIRIVDSVVYAGLSIRLNYPRKVYNGRYSQILNLSTEVRMIMPLVQKEVVSADYKPSKLYDMSCHFLIFCVAKRPVSGKRVEA